MEQRIIELYNLIASSQTALTQKEICEKLSQYYTYRESPTTHDNCPVIWRDINIINKSNEFEKIIIIDNNTYRIGTKEECLKYADKMMIKAVKALSRYWSLVHKINRDGQGDLLEKDKFIRSFIENDN